MLALLGILGCIITAVVVAGVAAVGTAVSIGLQVDAANKAEDAAEEQKAMQEAAQTKAENRAKATKATQDRQSAASLARQKMSVGSLITYERLSAERAKRKTAKTNAENQKKYFNGSPKV
ncbi:MAG: hypothetical protein ABH871_08360 [Pseudomonadota bacterium]